jgi:hypothetical protein
MRALGIHASENVFLARACHPTVQLPAAHQYATDDPDRPNLTVRDPFVGAAVGDAQ